MSKNEDAIKAVLRTKTIVGYLEPLFNGGSSFKFNLFIDTKEIEIKTGYLTTKEIVKEVLNNSVSFYDRPTNYESLIQVTENLPISSKDLARKAILLDEKIDDVEIGKRNPILARFYISATSKSHINTFNEKLKDDDDTQADHEIEHGLWLAICGMPIGVCLDSFDHSNYLPYTILVDIKDVAIRKELDAGRKGISSYRMNQIIEKSKELLTKHNFIKYRRYVVGGGDTRISDPLYDPKTELNNLLHDKEIYVTPLKNRYLPPIEEQEVIALFTELISINAIKGYLLKILSGYQVYDGLYIYNLDKNDNCIFTSNNTLGIRNEVFASQGDKLYKDILVEFKLELGGIYKDIDKNRKDFSQIDLLICWDTNFYDKEKLLKNRGDILQEVDTLSNVYYGVTHYLIGAGRQQVLPIIELKKVMQVLYGITIK